MLFNKMYKLKQLENIGKCLIVVHQTFLSYISLFILLSSGLWNKLKIGNELSTSVHFADIVIQLNKEECLVS